MQLAFRVNADVYQAAPFEAILRDSWSFLLSQLVFAPGFAHCGSLAAPFFRHVSR